MKFDPDKKAQTKDGSAVRILCTDRQAKKPIIALVYEEGGERHYTYYSNGRRFANGRNQRDLINIPETLWVNIYRSADGFDLGVSSLTKDGAIFKRDSDREVFACIKITDGDGLDGE